MKINLIFWQQILLARVSLRLIIIYLYMIFFVFFWFFFCRTWISIVANNLLNQFLYFAIKYLFLFLIRISFFVRVGRAICLPSMYATKWKARKMLRKFDRYEKLIRWYWWRSVYMYTNTFICVRYYMQIYLDIYHRFFCSLCMCVCVFVLFAKWKLLVVKIRENLNCC